MDRHSSVYAAVCHCLLCCSAGALPDQLEFSKDCKTLLVSNEGEPDGYGDPKYTDPEGSVSVINLDLVYTTGGSFNRRCKPKSNSRTSSARPCLVTGVTGTVRTAGFTAWNGKKEELLKQGISISGPGSTVAQDLEPEYTTFSADEKLAFVSLQVSLYRGWGCLCARQQCPGTCCACITCLICSSALVTVQSSSQEHPTHNCGLHRCTCLAD